MSARTILAGELAAFVGGELKGNPGIVLNAVAALDKASPEQVSFLGNKQYLPQLENSQAGVILLCAKLAKKATPREDQTVIICDSVDVAFSKAIMVFAPEPIKFAPGVHPAAVVAESAELGENVHVGACAVIEEGVKIGANTVIGAGCYIGHLTTIGAECQLAANVTITHRCVLGNKIIIHPGVVIGGDGYGFYPTPQGILKLPQVGNVQIDDDVEIGANATIDRARFGTTRIHTGTKIDNLVMIAHNVEVGAHCLLVAQVGIAGSAKIGNGVALGAKVGINGHITIGDGAQVAATSAVKDSLPPGVIAIGTPALPQREYVKRWAMPKKVARLTDKVKDLEAQLAAIKSQLDG
jgi:UDP-3-O-[3-hydroxymyristoyl] glucosamine N-acyltransferase